jgi:ribosome maturation factor RimP
VKQVLEPIVADAVKALGYELVELRIGGSRARPVLDIRIDRQDLARVAVGDCERASRAIEAVLDAMPATIDGRYVLEVSSPGAERPLRTLADWRRFAGRRANVKSARLAELGGRAEVEIVGVSDADAARESIIVRDLRGHEHSMALTDVDDARLAFHWKS